MEKKERVKKVGLIVAVLAVVFIIFISIPKASPQFSRTSVNLNTTKPLNKDFDFNGAKIVKPSLEAEKAEEKWLEVMNNGTGAELYQKVTFPLEMSDKPVRAVFYNGDISIESLDKFASSLSDWKPLSVDFISPTCVRYIYRSLIDVEGMDTYKGNRYWLYFVNKKLVLASLLRKDDDPQLAYKYDIQMLSRVDPSLFQEAQMDKQRKFEMYKVIMTKSNQGSERRSVLDNYMDRERESRANESYRDSMLDIEKKKLEIMRNQRNNSYNIDCHANGSNNINCTTSPSVIDLR